MIIVYTPADGQPEHFDARSLRVSEVSIVSRTIDQTWRQIREGLGEEDLDAMRGVAWVIKKRSTPSLRFGDFDPGVDEMVTRLDKTEVETYVSTAVAEAQQDPEVTAEQIAHALRALPDAALDREHAAAVIDRLANTPKDEAPVAEQEPQLPSGPTEESTSSEPSTSVSSLTSSTSLPQP